MTSTEKQFYYHKTAAGFTVLRGGWPDFLVIAPDGKTSAAEIKSGSDRVSPAQARMHAALERAGIPVTVVYDDGVLSLDPVFVQEQQEAAIRAVKLAEAESQRRVVEIAAEIKQREEAKAERYRFADAIIAGALAKARRRA